VTSIDTFTVLDFETTGLDPQVDQPVEVGLVHVRNGQIEETVEQLIDPGIDIPPMASATHHLVKADVAGHPSFAEVQEKLGLHDLETVVAHNARFDSAFLGHDPSTWIDTLRLSKWLWRDLESYSLQFLRYKLGLEVDTMGIMPHRALGDALVTTSLALRIFNELDDDPFVVQEQPIRQTICRFGNRHKNQYWCDVPGSYLDWMRKNVKDLDPDTEYTLQCEIEERGL